MALHRARDLPIRQRTQLINAPRAHLAELGFVAATGVEGMKTLCTIVTDPGSEKPLPATMRTALQPLVLQIEMLSVEIGKLEHAIRTEHRASEISLRLESIPGGGVITATVSAMTITDPSLFKSGRELAAWIGLVPRQNSTGGKTRLGGISKRGDRYLRRLLIVGAMAVIRHAKTRPEKYPWLIKLLANKMARIAWALLVKGGTYKTPALAVAA